MSGDQCSEQDQSGAKPDWWKNNEAYRARFDLPEYQPPQFQDGTHTHTVVDELEAEHDVTIRLLGVNTEFPDDIEVRSGSTTLFTIGRHRTSNGNTVYELTSDEFRDRVRDKISEQ